MTVLKLSFLSLVITFGTFGLSSLPSHAHSETKFDFSDEARAITEAQGAELKSGVDEGIALLRQKNMDYREADLEKVIEKSITIAESRISLSIQAIKKALNSDECKAGKFQMSQLQLLEHAKTQAHSAYRQINNTIDTGEPLSRSQVYSLRSIAHKYTALGLEIVERIDELKSVCDQ